ncbi:DUF4832 domain-containing protein [Anaerocolumna xylanovorans]|uniref:Beta-galactosidase n=1 Tax=Anaerocolumna xylanovorans DSM 12503 TaxID=1121345 RepID=A0A1M7Y6X2_9FIRM|nr:DUF4832 domain-containing protein [Anaerocolumna xylanovorans]SHO48397.1 Beta-galactosidase [Anaerocolumna xylanovorans DSM 12503]
MKRVTGFILVICMLLTSGFVSAADTKLTSGTQKYNTSSGSSSLKSLMAVQEHNQLFICVTGKELTGTYSLYIDTNNKEKTGTAAAGWAKADSVDYKITDDILYGFNKGKWQPVKSQDGFKLVRKDAVLEVSLDMKVLGLTESQAVKIGFYDGKNGLIPSAGKEMMTVDKAAPVISTPSIKIDGENSVSEWKSLKIAEGQDKIKELYAYKDTGKLYIMVLGEALKEANNNIYLNTDNNASTGYKNWGQYGENGAGADFLIESDDTGAWKLFQYVGPDWNWAEVKAPVEAVIKEKDGVQCLELSTDINSMKDIKKNIYISMGLNNDTGFAPKIWAELPYAKVIDLNGYGIKTDGKINDWTEVDSITAADKTALTLMAAQDSRKLYTVVKGRSMNTRNEYILDVKKGGFLYGIYSGVDYIVKDGYVYPLNGNNLIDASRKSAVYMDYQDDAVKMQLKLSQIGNPAKGSIYIAYKGKNILKLPQNGSKLKVTSVWKTAGEKDTFYPAEDYASNANPYKGWLPWASHDSVKEPLAQEVKMAYFDIKWSELEPTEGKYDFTAVEEKYHFKYWREKGVRLNLRFVMDDPSDNPNHMDIPKWLYDKLVKENYNGGKGGKWYNSPAIGAGFAPDYNSPLLLAAHEKAIKALAKRYDNPGIISFIQIGSLGHWAEFHNWPEDISGKFPDLSISDKYVGHYLDNFKKVKLGMRKPYPIASKNKLGLFNDVFGMADTTAQFLDWAQNGWDEIGEYVDAASGYSSPEEARKASAMSDFWKNNYSGGEFANGNVRLYIDDTTIMDTLRQVRESHTSWLGPCSPADLLKSDKDAYLYQCNIDALTNIIGYNFVLEAVTHNGKAKTGNNLSVKMKWNNKGVAPFYYNWPLELSLADSKGKIAAKTITSADITKWLPGETVTTQSISIPKNLKKGEYTLCVAILDPQTGKPGIKLGIEGIRSDGRYTLNKITAGD